MIDRASLAKGNTICCSHIMTSSLLSSPSTRKRRVLNDLAALLDNKNGNTNSSFSSHPTPISDNTDVSLDTGSNGNQENKFYGEYNESGADIWAVADDDSQSNLGDTPEHSGVSEVNTSIGHVSSATEQIKTLRLLKRRDMAERSRKSKDAVVSDIRTIRQSNTPDMNTRMVKSQPRISATLAFKDDDALYGYLVRQDPNITSTSLRKQWKKTLRAASSGIPPFRLSQPLDSLSQDPSLYQESESSSIYDRIRVAGAESQFFRQYMSRNHNVTAADPSPMEFPVDQWRKYVNEKLANKDGQQPVEKLSAEQHLLDLWEREYDLRCIDRRQKDVRTMRSSDKVTRVTPSKKHPSEKQERMFEGKRNEAAQLFITLEKQKHVGQLLQELGHLAAAYETEHQSLIEEMDFWVDMIADQREQQGEMLAEQERLRAFLHQIK